MRQDILGYTEIGQHVDEPLYILPKMKYIQHPSLENPWSETYKKLI